MGKRLEKDEKNLMKFLPIFFQSLSSRVDVGPILAVGLMSQWLLSKKMAVRNERKEGNYAYTGGRR